jgi:hypothetical protein
MKRLLFPLKSKRGQASIEFCIIAPITIALFLFMIMIALIWHGQHLTMQSALEGVAGGNSELGGSRATMIDNGWMSGYGIHLSGSQIGTQETYFKGKSLTLWFTGKVPEFTFFGVTSSGQMNQQMVVPVWKFYPNRITN